jgi:hypothetical protein
MTLGNINLIPIPNLNQEKISLRLNNTNNLGLEWNPKPKENPKFPSLV